MSFPGHSTGLKGCIGGRFAERGGQIVLLDDLGNATELDRCTILMGGWGDADEGVSKLPRVEVMDAAGKVIVPGDRVVILHAQGNARRPVVLGGVRPLGAHEFLARLHSDESADANALRVRLLARDAQGAEGGRVDLEAGAGDGGGVDLEATDHVTVRVGADPDALTALVLQLLTSGAVFSMGGSAQPVILGTSFLTGLSTWLVGLTTFVGATSVATTAAQIATAAGVFAPIHAAFAGQVSTTLSAQGAPYLSGTLKTD